MKHFIPQVLLILFFNLAWSDNGAGEPNLGNYGSYVNVPYQMVGIILVAFAFITILIGILAPAVFEPFDLTTIEIEPVKAAAGESDSSDHKKEEEVAVAAEEEAEA